MKTNMGNADRVIRFLVAIAAAVLYFTGTVTGVLGYIVLAIGAIFLLTSVVGTCPLYSLVGVNTCPAKKG